MGDRFLVLISIVGWTVLTYVPPGPEGQSPKPDASDAYTEELQKATQNPVSSLISVPFRNNADLNIGSLCLWQEHAQRSTGDPDEAQ